MYIIAIIMFVNGAHQIASDQMLYANLEMCEVAEAVLVQNLEAAKPTPESFVITKCVEMSFAKESKGIAI